MSSDTTLNEPMAFHELVVRKIILDMKLTEVDIDRDTKCGAETALIIVFTDLSTVRITDRTDCCEKRYMRTDDELSFFFGSTWVSHEIREAPSIEDDGPYKQDHDVEFFVIHTSKGDITFSNHNEHNGWYGGFDMNASYRSSDDSEPLIFRL